MNEVIDFSRYAPAAVCSHCGKSWPQREVEGQIYYECPFCGGVGVMENQYVEKG